MAKFRQVHVEFWQDGFVLDLTPEEKYFYLYLMTNSKTSQCGIYELPKRIIETETGYNRETVDKLLQRFIDYGKIKYDESTKEIMIVNWIKYNMINSSKVIACIKKELEQVKNKRFVNEFIALCKRYGYGIDTLCIDYGEEKEQEKEKEEEKEQNVESLETIEIEKLDEIERVYQFYQSHFGIPSPYVMQSINQWVNDLNTELVLKALEITYKEGKTWKYTEGILRNWTKDGITSLTDLENKEKKKAPPRRQDKMVEAYRKYIEQLKEDEE
jgi:DnaD/phage-associated family protein